MVRDEEQCPGMHLKINDVRAKLLVRSFNSLIIIMMPLLGALGGERAGARTTLYYTNNNNNNRPNYCRICSTVRRALVRRTGNVETRNKGCVVLKIEKKTGTKGGTVICC